MVEQVRGSARVSVVTGAVNSQYSLGVSGDAYEDTPSSIPASLDSGDLTALSSRKVLSLLAGITAYLIEALADLVQVGSAGGTKNNQKSNQKHQPQFSHDPSNFGSVSRVFRLRSILARIHGSVKARFECSASQDGKYLSWLLVSNM